VLQPATRAVVLGHLHDADAIPVYPAMIAFENSLGGRVIIHAWDYASAIDGFGVSFHNPVRCRQIQATVRWLFRSRVPLAARGDGVWPLALRKDCGNETLVGLMNLSLDAWPCAEIEMSAPAAPAAIRLLDADGKWIPVDSRAWETRDSVILLTLVRPVALESPLFLNVVWK
jgi:hypothetical protein